MLFFESKKSERQETILKESYLNDDGDDNVQSIDDVNGIEPLITVNEQNKKNFWRQVKDVDLYPN